MKKYIRNILLWLTQGLNTLTGGDPDESTCSRVYKISVRGCGWFPKQFVKFMNLFEKEHCKKSLEEDEGNDAVIK